MRQDQGVEAGMGRRMGAALLAVALAGAFLLAACGSSDAKGDDTTTTRVKATTTTTTSTESTTTTTDPAAVTTTTGGNVDELSGAFVSSEVVGYDLAPDTQLSFTFQGDSLAVNAGCNTMSATYQVADSVLKWTGVPAATMMACEDALEAQDAWITGLLTKGMDAEGLDGGTTLTLTSGDVEITLEAVADSPLTGTTWTLESTTEADAAASLPADGNPPTLTIDEDGTAEVFAGCNTGSTKVAITDTQLTFGPLPLTRMACPGGASQLEAQVVAVLDGTVAYTIDGDQLTLVNGGNGLVYRAS